MGPGGAACEVIDRADDDQGNRLSSCPALLLR